MKKSIIILTVCIALLFSFSALAINLPDEIVNGINALDGMEYQGVYSTSVIASQLNAKQLPSGFLVMIFPEDMFISYTPLTMVDGSFCWVSSNADSIATILSTYGEDEIIMAADTSTGSYYCYSKDLKQSAVDNLTGFNNLNDYCSVILSKMK